MKTLIVYSGATDLESTSASQDWQALLYEFDTIVLILLLEDESLEEFASGVDLRTYSNVLDFERSNGMSQAFINEIQNAITNANQSYLQIASHGSNLGLAIRRPDKSGVLESLVTYESIVSMFEDHDSRLAFNLMTVCHSNDIQITNLPLEFFATTEGESDQSEAITDSLNVINAIDENGHSENALINVVGNCTNQYHLYLNENQIFPTQQ
jgi:hypothetical protein